VEDSKGVDGPSGPRENVGVGKRVARPLEFHGFEWNLDWWAIQSKRLLEVYVAICRGPAMMKVADLNIIEATRLNACLSLHRVISVLFGVALEDKLASIIECGFQFRLCTSSAITFGS